MKHLRKGIDVGVGEFGVEMPELLLGQGLPNLPNRPQRM